MIAFVVTDYRATEKRSVIFVGFRLRICAIPAGRQIATIWGLILRLRAILCNDFG